MKNLINRKCNTCGSIFQTTISRVNNGGGKYCSKKCSYNNNERREKARIFMLGKTMSTKTKNKLRDIGKKMIGCKARNWKGGRRLDTDGYIILYMPEHPCCDIHKNVKEHRMVVEKSIGRYLKPEERVHHINGIITDNRIENLQLFKNMTEHINYHRFNIKYWSCKGVKHKHEINE